MAPRLLYVTLLLVVVHFIQGTARQIDDATELVDLIIPPWVDAYGQTPNIRVELSFDGIPLRENSLFFTFNQTQIAPIVRICGPDFVPDGGYTFIIVDPDAPNPAHPFIKNVVHWIVSNIPGSRNCQNITETGTIVLHYVTPRKPVSIPPPYGIHRYFNLLFKQPSRYENIMNITSPRPSIFSTRNFTQTYNLGYPVAGKVFKVNLDN